MLTTPVKARSQQLGLFLPLSPDPERLEITLARIQNTLGENRVGAPVLLDTHSPNAFRQNRFVLPEMKEKRSVTEKQTTAALRIFEQGLLRLNTTIVITVLSLAGFALSIVWLHAGRRVVLRKIRLA